VSPGGDQRAHPLDAGRRRPEEMAPVRPRLSFARTRSVGQALDPIALLWAESRPDDQHAAPPGSTLTVFLRHRYLALENLALRQQLAVYKRTAPRSKLRMSDRLFWIGMSRTWAGWRQALVIVAPDTVLRWHRRRFHEHWAQLSGRPRVGRPPVNAEIIVLVGKMAAANPLWGAPRIHAELLKLGIAVAERTVSRLISKRRPPPSQTWRTFFANHVRDLVSIDSSRCRPLTYACSSSWSSSPIIGGASSTSTSPSIPTAEWTAQQIVDTFPDDTAPSYLLRDRDEIYGHAFRHRVKGMQIREVLTAARSPWENPFVERLIGSIRRECLDHVLVLSERHLRRLLTRYFACYHRARTHLALDKEAPDERPIEPPERDLVAQLPEVGGLHHRYVRRAA
jgi:putative transposase